MMKAEVKRISVNKNGAAGRRGTLRWIPVFLLIGAGTLFAETDKTIVLEEATISARGQRSTGGGDAASGAQLPKVPAAPGILPLLPTPFPWEGEEEKWKSVLSEEIFKVLTEPDPSYWPAEMNSGIATRE